MSEFNPTEATGVPKYYSLWDEQNIVVAPTPDATYTMDESLAFIYGEEWGQGPDAMGPDCKDVQDYGGDGPAMEDTSALRNREGAELIFGGRRQQEVLSAWYP